MAWTVEWDSDLIRPEAWDPAFLEVDWIGAPWDRQGKFRVGNSGFALQSLGMLRAMAAHSTEFLPKYYPYDVTACERLRPVFEAEGLTWASEDLAKRFSWEKSKAYASYNGALGVHGLKARKDFLR